MSHSLHVMYNTAMVQNIVLEKDLLILYSTDIAMNYLILDLDIKGSKSREQPYQQPVLC